MPTDDDKLRSPAQPLRIGPVAVKNCAILAPMSGVTDAPFRRQVATLGAGLVISEMTACAGLVRGEREAAVRSDGAGIGIHVVQLAGCEAQWMERGAEIARDTLAPYMRRAGKLAADVADYGRNDGADIARDTVRRYAHRAGELASEAIDYGRQEGTLLAQAAAVQALRAGRAVKADPVPIIVGAVSVALFANLLFGRRRD